ACETITQSNIKLQAVGAATAGVVFIWLVEFGGGVAAAAPVSPGGGGGVSADAGGPAAGCVCAPAYTREKPKHIN
ncbi:MAG: hypothetical protein V4587_16850, partial [Acidobacteriota bacterium]